LAAAASNAASNAAAALVLVTPKPRGRPPKKKTKKKQNQEDRENRREAALLESATITDSPLPGSPLAPSILALLSPGSVASVGGFPPELAFSERVAEVRDSPNY
jgi:hypothetical protein